jgi:hypothetical protein
MGYHRRRRRRPVTPRQAGRRVHPCEGKKILTPAAAAAREEICCQGC